ncbi:MAG: putative selenium-dependent hydroxylase accessory protein YqeC [Candidatus Tectomicrobia bacterium]|nr:putative selenium-dependent hydroxylase accessory protein YqeC [Candidatus Tectomicrobia bacterium]
MTLLESFAIPQKSSVAIVGAGGKTTLLYRLAREMAPEAAKSGGIVLITTTTKIFRPSEEEAEAVILSADLEEARKRIRKAARKDLRVVLAAGAHPDPRYGREKLNGIPPGWAGALLGLDEVAWLLVEADGSQRRPLKAPGEGEPVWPEPTHVALGVLGLSALGRPLGLEWAFRPERVSSVTGLAVGEALGPGAFAAILAHPEGIFRGCPDSARVIGFLNQADDPHRVVLGQEIGYILRKEQVSRMEALFVGRLESGDFQRVYSKIG